MVVVYFWKWLRDNHRQVHRWMGRIYLFGGIFPASISGIIVAQETVAGLTGRIGFSLLAILWFVTGAMALNAILKGRTEEHQQWMIRNFSLTFAAVTLRLWIPVLVMFQVGLGGIDGQVAFAQAYQTVPWLCWVPNLIIAEMLILRKLRHSFSLKLSLK